MDTVYSLLAIALLWVLFLIVTRQADQATRTEEALATLDALLGEEKISQMGLADLYLKMYMERMGIDLKAEGYLRLEENRKREE